MDNKIIKEMEERYPEMTTEFKRLQASDYELFCKKQSDYGPGNIAMGTNLESVADKEVSLIGIVIRTKDKIERLVNLVIRRDRAPENESIEDSFLDTTVYGLIARIVINGKWGK